MLELTNRSCPVCTSNSLRVIGRPRRVDRIFADLNNKRIDDCRIVQCGKCSLYFVNPFPSFSQKLLQKMYSNENEYFQEFTKRMERIIHYQNPERRLSAIEKYQSRPVQKFLEIGCGQGFGLQAAQRRGWCCSGQDVSTDFARVVKQRTGIDILVGQLNGDSFSEEYFDAIYVDSVLEHVPNPVEYMTHLRKFLSPGGILYLTLPNEGSVPNSLIDLVYLIRGQSVTSRMMPFSEPYHILGFTKKSVNQLGSSVGLRILRLTCNHSYNHIQRYKGKTSTIKSIRRTALGIFHLVCDAFNSGMNMEVVFIKD